MAKTSEKVISPVVHEVEAISDPLGQGVELLWRQLPTSTFRILRRADNRPTGLEIPLIEVSKIFYEGGFFLSPFSFLDGFQERADLEKVEIYQFIEKEVPKTGLLFVLDHLKNSLQFRSYRLEGRFDILNILDHEQMEVKTKVENKKKGQVTNFYINDDPAQSLVEIRDGFGEEGTREMTVKLMTGQLYKFQRLQILKMERDDDNDELVGRLTDVGLEPETDFHYCFEPTLDTPLQKVHTSARSFGVYNMHKKLKDYLPQHYLSNDRFGQLQRFLEVVGFSLNNLRGSAEDLRDIQNIDKCRLELLPYLAQWLGWDFPRSEMSHLREDLKDAIILYRRKGTKKGLKQLIQKITGKECRKIIEYRQEMFFTNDGLNRTNSLDSKTCEFVPSTIDIEFAPFAEWKGGSYGLLKDNLKKWIQKFLPAHVKIGEIRYEILPLEERYDGVQESVNTVLYSGEENLWAEKKIREKVTTKVEAATQKLELFRTNEKDSKTNERMYRTYHPLLHRKLKNENTDKDKDKK